MRALAAVLVMALLAGCAAAPQPLLTPLAPATLGRSVEVRQQVIATYRDRKRVMQATLKVTPQDLTLIGLSPIGQRLFTLSWDGSDTHLASGVHELSGLDPDRILADLELAYWPLGPLRDALAGALRLEQRGTARMLWDSDTLVWVASSASRDRWTSPMTVYNARFGYRLDIRPLKMSQATP